MGKRRQLASILSIVVLLLLAACAPNAAPAPVGQSPASKAAPAKAPEPATASSAQSAPVKPAWQQELDKALEAAKREGGLTLYTSMPAEARRIMSGPFEKKYGLKLETISGPASLLVARIHAEQRGGIYAADTWISGSTTYRLFPPEALERLDPMLVLPELTEPELIKKTWYFGEVPWSNKAHTMVIGLMSFNEVIVANTDLVKADDLKTYQDLLNPKWKGKISIQDPRSSGMGNMWFAVALEVKDVDAAFMRDLLTKQELFVTRDPRLQIEWVARGKHAITIGPETSIATDFIRMGTPIRRFSLGTPFVSGATSGIGMMKNVPHPGATKVFLNWLLSQEGQTLHSKAVGAQAQRLDASTSHLDATKVLGPGLKVYRSDNEEIAQKRTGVYMQMANEIFGQ